LLFLKKYYKNRMATPITVITAPRISLKLTFSFRNRTAGGIIKTGTIAMIVEAIPVEVFLIANKEKETPRKGPKKDPTAN